MAVAVAILKNKDQRRPDVIKTSCSMDVHSIDECVKLTRERSRSSAVYVMTNPVIASKTHPVTVPAKCTAEGILKIPAPTIDMSRVKNTLPALYL